MSDEQWSEREKVENAFRNLAAGTATGTGQIFFDAAVKHLAQALDVKFAFIGLLELPQVHSVNTLAVWADGQHVPNFTYSLSNTPCKNVTQQGFCTYPNNVCSLFKEDLLLQQMGVESYMGLPLFDSANNCLGLLVVLDDKPMTRTDFFHYIMESFAARIAAEIVRLRAEAELRTINLFLEEKVQTRTNEIARVNAELEAFSYSVSHDLRAPLRAVIGFLQALREDFVDKIPPEAAHYLDRANQAGLRMNQLIDDLMGLSRVSNTEVVRRRISLRAILHTLVEELKTNYPKHDFHINLSDNESVDADYGLLQVILQNLLDNACKYSSRRERPTVSVSIRRQDDRQVIVIADNGTGFDVDANKDKIFQPFQRFHSDKEFSGTGIGLATVRRAVERHQGELWVTSKIDVGSEFCFTLQAPEGSASKNKQHSLTN